MLSGTRKEREPQPAAPVGAGLVPAQPTPANPAGPIQTKVYDAGDGVKVAVTGPESSFIDTEAKWRAQIAKDVQTIRSRLGWILFFIAAVIAIQLLSGLFSGLR